jgi:hypothetical protein
MKDKLSARQMINVELAERAKNKKSSKVLKRHVPKEEQAGLVIPFNCECSDPDCTERLPMTLQAYEKMHSSSGQFVVAKGHSTPRVEKVTDVKDNITVVEKFALS